MGLAKDFCLRSRALGDFAIEERPRSDPHFPPFHLPFVRAGSKFRNKVIPFVSNYLGSRSFRPFSMLELAAARYLAHLPQLQDMNVDSEPIDRMVVVIRWFLAAFAELEVRFTWNAQNFLVSPPVGWSVSRLCAPPVQPSAKFHIFPPQKFENLHLPTSIDHQFSPGRIGPSFGFRLLKLVARSHSGSWSLRLLSLASSFPAREFPHHHHPFISI